jgi:hypothetical protein
VADPAPQAGMVVRAVGLFEVKVDHSDSSVAAPVPTAHDDGLIGLRSESRISPFLHEMMETVLMAFKVHIFWLQSFGRRYLLVSF